MLSDRSFCSFNVNPKAVFRHPDDLSVTGQVDLLNSTYYLQHINGYQVGMFHVILAALREGVRT